MYRRFPILFPPTCFLIALDFLRMPFFFSDTSVTGRRRVCLLLSALLGPFSEAPVICFPRFRPCSTLELCCGRSLSPPFFLAASPPSIRLPPSSFPGNSREFLAFNRSLLVYYSLLTSLAAVGRTCNYRRRPIPFAFPPFGIFFFTFSFLACA